MSVVPPPVVAAAVDRLRDLTGLPVPEHLASWADRCRVPAGFPLLGTTHSAEPYVALQWNGERASRAGRDLADLVVLTGLVAAWQHDRTVADLQSAVARALAMRAEQPGVSLGAPVTADVVTTAVCAGLLSGVPEGELTALQDVAGTLLQVRPAGPDSSPEGDGAARLTDAEHLTSEHLALEHRAAGHTAAAGWLAVQVHQSGLVAYPGAFADTVATASFSAPALDTHGTVRTLVDSLR